MILIEMSLAIQPFFLCAWAHVPLCLWNGGLGVPHNTVCYTTSRSPDKTSSPCIVKLSGENYGVLNHQVPCGITHSRYPKCIKHFILGTTEP